METRTGGSSAMAQHLPAPVQRWLERTPGGPDMDGTMVIEGSARFRRGGRGLWLSIEAMMWHQLGHGHVVDLRVGLGPLTFVRGLDGYVDGTGFSRISHTLDMGPEIDQAALLFMWSEALLVPAAWLARDDLEWIAVDDETVDVRFPSPAGPVPARLSFDPATGLPSRFSAERFKGIGAPKVEWNVDYADWGPTEDGVHLPATAEVTWADEAGPWFRMHIRRANPGADISEAMARGRRLLEEAAADPTRTRTR